MRFTIATAAAFAGAASASYGYGSPAANTTSVVAPEAPVYTTEVVTAITTVCPSATEITHGGKTYTVTEATTLTISDCPCTVTNEVPAPSAPVETPVGPSGPAETPAVPTAPVESIPVPTESATAPVEFTSIPGIPGGCNPAHPGSCPTPSPSGMVPVYPTGNGTVPAGPTGTGSPSGTATPPEFTGAAAKFVPGFLAVAGAVAAFL